MKNIVADINDSNHIDLLLAKKLIPSNIKKIKSHPLYCTNIYLKKYEIIYPNDPKTAIGVIKVKDKIHYIYLKKTHLKMLRSSIGWELYGRTIKKFEQPIKYIKKSKISKAINPMTGLYGIWQTIEIDNNNNNNK